jgi:uncharacterized protein
VVYQGKTELMEMDENSPLRYDLWIEDALRAVINRTLTYAETSGLPGEHHFYITFRTTDDDVDVPDFIRADHPEEMTIILQHQFENLKVSKDLFEVTLRFNGRPARLVIPLSSVISFADPSVNFGLQLKMTTIEEDEMEMEFGYGADSNQDTGSNSSDGDAPDDEPKTGEVIALDAFRKKT